MLATRTLLALPLLLASGRAAVAQHCNPATHVAPVKAALHSYTGDAEDSTEPRTQSIPHNGQQMYRLFVPPTGERPAQGWPVLVCTGLGGYVAATVNPCIDKSTLQGKALAQGIAVIMAGMTLSTETMACESGVERIVGHGLFHPPGVVPPGLGVAPYDSPAYAMPEKDAVMLVQHVRHNGGRPGLLADIDPQRVAVLGQSAGANSFMWTAFGPDRRGEEPFLSLGGQFDEPTRPDAAILRGGFVWWPIFSPQVPADPPYLVLHFGSQGDAEKPAATIADCSPAELQADSALYYEAAFPTPSLPTLMTYGEPAYCTDYTSNGPDGELAFSFTGGGLEGRANLREDTCDDGVPPDEQPGGMHPSWAGFTWQALHPASCRLLIASAETFHCYAHGTQAEAVGARNIDDLVVAWLAARFAELPRRWEVFEQARIDGVRRQVGTEGSPLRLLGSGGRVLLSGAPPHARGRLRVGATAEPQLVAGRLRLPVSLDLDPIDIATDAEGHWSMDVGELLRSGEGHWWYQAWIDEGEMQDAVGSNALRETIP